MTFDLSRSTKVKSDITIGKVICYFLYASNTILCSNCNLLYTKKAFFILKARKWRSPTSEVLLWAIQSKWNLYCTLRVIRCVCWCNLKKSYWTVFEKIEQTCENRPFLANFGPNWAHFGSVPAIQWKQNSWCTLRARRSVCMRNTKKSYWTVFEKIKQTCENRPFLANFGPKWAHFGSLRAILWKRNSWCTFKGKEICLHAQYIKKLLNSFWEN